MVFIFRNGEVGEMEEDIKKIAEGYEKYAKQCGFRLNPDRKMVEAIVSGLVMNQKKYGARYCPCRIVTGNKEEDRKIICPCAYHRSELRETGRCHCGLYLK